MTPSWSKSVLCVALLLGSTASALAFALPTVRYVDQHATGDNSGTSWHDAFTSLQAALDVAGEDDIIRIAGGTYVPTKLTNPLSPRSATFMLTHTYRLFGGYAGSAGPDPNVRDVSLYPSILSGDLPAPASTTAYFIVTLTYAKEPELDGLTFAKGVSPQYSYTGYGFFITNGHPTIRNCTFRGSVELSAGSGIYVDDAYLDAESCAFVGGGSHSGDVAIDCDSSTVSLRGCSFTQYANYSFQQYWNYLPYTAVFSYDSTLTLTDCIFHDNGTRALTIDDSTLIATSVVFENNHGLGSGGAISATDSTIRARRCSFSSNSTAYVATQYEPPKVFGGAVFLSGCDSNFVNCRFHQNLANYTGSGGALAVIAGTAILSNCAIWGNRVETFTDFHHPEYGAAAYSSGSADLTFINCTIVNNMASSDSTFPEMSGALVGGVYGNCHVRNCIVWGNSDDYGAYSAQFGGGSVSLANSCILGLQPFSGIIGNISDEPAFVDADGPDQALGTADDDLRLSANSPCIDAGDGYYIAADALDLDGDGDVLESLPLDLDDTVRGADDLDVPNWPLSGGDTPVDMGAYERSAWDNLGNALATAHGKACLYGTGPLLGNTPTSLNLSSTAENSLAFLLGGVATLDVPFKGGVLVPNALPGFGFTLGMVTGPTGQIALSNTWPVGVPSGFTVYLQAWIADPSGPAGFAASNAVAGTTP